MRIAILASEGAPYVKSGGLGDVMEALPAALQRIEGNEVMLILPYYKKIKENPAFETEVMAQFYVGLGWRRQYTKSTTQTIVKPKTNLIKPATILPSENLVRAPQIHAVTGMIARITLTRYPKPK